jgi:hypothetical protein
MAMETSCFIYLVETERGMRQPHWIAGETISVPKAAKGIWLDGAIEI